MQIGDLTEVEKLIRGG